MVNMSPDSFIPSDPAIQRKALEGLPLRVGLDMNVEHAVSPDDLCHNTTERLPPTDLDLERQCAGPGDMTPTWWRWIWGIIVSLFFKTGASAARPRTNSNLSSTPNMRVHSNQPTIEAVQRNSVESGAVYTAVLMRAKGDSKSIRTFKETTRVRSPQPLPPPPPASDTHEPCQDGLLDDGELDDLLSLVEDASSHISPPI